MKNKQSLRLHQAQRQRQAFSPARGRFIEILTKNRQELAAELRSLIAVNPFLHTVADEVLFAQAQPESDLRADLLTQLHTGRCAAASTPRSTSSKRWMIMVSTIPPSRRPVFRWRTSRAALEVIQQLEPFGVGCRDSLDFIRCQLKSRNETTALRVLNEGAAELSTHRTNALCRKLNITETELNRQLEIIRTCQLYPCQLGSD